MNIKTNALLLFLFATNAFATEGSKQASFDCNKASSFTELMICSTPELGTLDIQLNDVYKKALAANPDNKAIIKKTEIYWIKNIRNKATNAQDLATSYKARIADLQMSLNTNPTPVDQSVSSIQSKNTDVATQASAEPTVQNTADASAQSTIPAPTQQGTAQTAPEQKSALQIKAESGDKDAQADWGIQLSNGNNEQQKESIKWLQLASQNNIPKAENCLGVMYMIGQVVEHDTNKGLQLIQKAADANNVDAQMEMGNFYSDGEGVPVDYNKSLFWYNKAKENGASVDDDIAIVQKKMADAEKYKDGYLAVITCGPSSDGESVDACFVDSDLKITNDNISHTYNTNQGAMPSRAGKPEADGLYFRLTKNFRVWAQNSMEGEMLTVKILRASDNTVVYQDQATNSNIIDVSTGDLQ